MTEDEVPEGYCREWVAESDADWKVGGDGRKCRMKGCQNPAVAALSRKHGKFRAWWYYCESHLYGRKIEDGVVKGKRLVPLGKLDGIL